LWWGQIFSITVIDSRSRAGGLFYEHSRTDPSVSYAALLAAFAT